MRLEQEENVDTGEFLNEGKEIIRKERGNVEIYEREREVLGMAAQREQRKVALAAGKRKRESLKAALFEEQ